MEMRSSPGQKPGATPKIMFVEDDAVVARIYIQKLTDSGFQVGYAEDGVEALKKMPGFKPDLVVLDLVMPRMTGPDVLRFMRQNPELKSTRVIVFSNSFLANQVEQVAVMGVDLALVKSVVTPAILVDEINKVLGIMPADVTAPAPVAAPASESSGPQPPAATGKPAPAAGKPEPSKETDTAFLTRIDQQFLQRTPIAFNDLRGLSREFVDATEPEAQVDRLTALRKKLGFIVQISAMAGYQRTAELASALDALLYELASQPALIGDSTRQTIASIVAQLTRAFDGSATAPVPDRRQAAILVVDPDAESGRVVAEALAWAQIPATTVANPAEALKLLEQTRYHAVLLDLNAPEMGTTLRQQTRRLPQNNQTPVVYVTSQEDYPARAESILSAGDDLIAKPISAAELCVKIIGHLQRAG
jgi:CheY-like chemotaxis protein